ncbi:hypothetical protein [Actinoplanes sp. NPDC051494]|uniref:hypothetical protein n=1 Tax=Actinoplanes sp. NPDC051494 TaxID=3363907 RepID=UPI0037908DB5
MTSKLAPGASCTKYHGHLSIRTDRHHDGISITVLAGATHSSTLSRTFTNDRIAAARVWYRELVEAADQGLKVTQIEDRMAAILAAGHAVTEIGVPIA